MKHSLLFHSVLCILAVSSLSLSQDLPRRFRFPMDVETEMLAGKKGTFSDHTSDYSSSVFINVNISRDSFPQNEPSIKISRKNPNRVVAAWRDFRRGVSNPTNRQIGYSYSTDGGFTWSVSRLLDSTLLPGFPRNSDPVVVEDSSGHFYIAVVCIGNAVGLGVYKSTDGGVNFPQAYLVANTGSEDKEWIDNDRVPGSPYFNNLYMSWTRFSGNTGIKMALSSNGGVNWTNAVSVSDQTSGVQGSDLAVGLNGEVYVTWLDVNTPDDVIKFDKSTNGGATFGTDLNIASGTTPNIPISSSNVTFPSIATDISNGPGRGNIYVAFCDARNGDPDIFFTKSTNRGANWSAPVRLNDDAVSNGKLQCWPWIEVNDSGNIAVLFYDSRNTTSNNIIEAYLAYSTNQGATFVNRLISTQPSPTNQPNTAVRFGDYICLDYHRDRITPIWTDERAGGVNMEAYTAQISTPLLVEQVSPEIPDGFMLRQNYPNPFNPSTVIEFTVPQREFISLKVFDRLGREVAVLAEGVSAPGKFRTTFNAGESAAGVYFCRMTAGKFSETIKLMLVK